MSDAPKVVSLRGEEILPPGEPRPKVIALLEDLLEKARSGEVIAVAVAMRFGDDFYGWEYEGSCNDGIIGAMERMKAHMIGNL